MKNILAIIGSASKDSSNLKLIQYIQEKTAPIFNLSIYDRLNEMPHFSPERTLEDTPQQITELRLLIDKADGILISTPEYIFSIPSGLKNILEWSVATTIFSEKPTGILTASANGEKAHEELVLIMKTLMAHFTTDTTLLIKGIKGKIDSYLHILDEETERQLFQFINSFKALLD